MTTLSRYSRMWRGRLVLLALAAGTGVVVTGLGTLPGPVAWSDVEPPVSPGSPPPQLEDRLGAMDAAIARDDLSRAIFEWRDVYGVALRARRWEDMVAAGDAARRVDTLARRHSDRLRVFQLEAREAYMQALFLARAARSVQGVDRVADAFASLGDAEMAARARTVLVR